jgi:hypothetical protein
MLTPFVSFYGNTTINVRPRFYATQQTTYNRRMEPRPRGRPPTPPEERLIVRSIRLTAAQWAKLDKLGMVWLRKAINRAKPPA